MGKYQRTGRAGANTKPCKVGYSDKHNLRQGPTEQIPTNPNTSIRSELTKNNSFWQAPDVPSLWRLDQAIRKDYAATPRTVTVKGVEHICHRELPSKGKTAASPIKETILNLPNNNSDSDAMVEAFAKRVEQLTGWRCIRRVTHRDERYDDPDTGEQHFNCHSHLVWDCYDHQQHQIIRVGKTTMRQIQDIASEVTGMERGIDARITKAEHLSVAEFKNQEERQRAEEIRKKNIELQTENANLRQIRDTRITQLCGQLQILSRNMVQQFDYLAQIVEPSDKERLERDQLDEDSRRDKTGINIKEIHHLNLRLQRGLDVVALAVSNLTKKVVQLAKQVPLLGLRSKRLQHEAALQKAAADATNKANKAIKDVTEQQTKLNAERAEIDKEKDQIRKEQSELQKIRKTAYDEGYNNGVSATEAEYQKELEQEASFGEVSLPHGTISELITAIHHLHLEAHQNELKAKNERIKYLEKKLNETQQNNLKLREQITTKTTQTVKLSRH